MKNKTPAQSRKNFFSRPKTIKENIFTCENCAITTDKNFGRCSYCGHRLLTNEEVQARENAVGYGAVLIGFGLVMGIVTATVTVLQKDFVFVELFTETAFRGNYFNTTLFFFLFSFPIALIFTGIISVVTKKATDKRQIVIFISVFILLQLFDFFIRTFL
jgi:uncharacterized paraquat-inducible protein A